MEQICPNCGAAIPVTEGYPVWCDKCDWGVELVKRPQKTNVFTKTYDRLSTQQAYTIYIDVLRNNGRPAGLTPSTLLAYAIAGMVTLVTFSFVAFAAYIVGFVLVEWLSGRTPPTVCLGIFALPLLLGAAWFFRPQLGRLPRIYLSRAEAPHLYALADRVAKALGAKPIKAIVLDCEYNASYSEAGVLRQPVMTLGLPALIASTPQEVVAIIGHEVAHGVNGDPNRGLLLHSSINSLRRWYFLLSPESAITIPVVGIIVMGILFVISSIPRLLDTALSYLTFSTMQRAEYYADALGAKISGTDAAVSALRKTELAANFYLVAKRTWDRRRVRPLSVWSEFREYVSGLPPREYQRFVHAQAGVKSRLDNTHPPTEFRIQALKKFSIKDSQIVLTQSEYESIIAETKPFEKQLEIKLMND